MLDSSIMKWFLKILAGVALLVLGLVWAVTGVTSAISAAARSRPGWVLDFLILIPAVSMIIVAVVLLRMTRH